MMKKLYALVAALMVSVAANAQFEQGKFYMNGSLTGLNMSYSGNTKFNMGASGQMGYMVADAGSFTDRWLTTTMAQRTSATPTRLVLAAATTLSRTASISA